MAAMEMSQAHLGEFLRGGQLRQGALVYERLRRGQNRVAAGKERSGRQQNGYRKQRCASR